MRERDIYRFAATTVLAATLLTSADTSPKRTDCVGKIDWEDKRKDIAVCLNKDNRVVIQSPNTPERMLEEGVCRITQVWVSYTVPNKISWFKYLDNNYSFSINSMDIETGVIGEAQIYSIPYNYGYHNNDEICPK